jgi:hypothetical protein
LGSTPKQRGGITGKGFLPGVSGNPSGRPKGERRLLMELYGEDGEKLFRELDRLKQDAKTPVRWKIEINQFLVERLHGRAQQRVEVGGHDGQPVKIEVVTGLPAPQGKDRDAR